MGHKEKGATFLDKLCHKLYDLPKDNGLQVDGVCKKCGGSLLTYYCEERLYLIVCQKCGTIALTKDCAPQVAANLTLAAKEPAIHRMTEFFSRLEDAEARAEEAEKRLALAIRDMTALAHVIRKRKTDDCECCFVCRYNGPADQYCPGWDEVECFTWEPKE